MIRQRRWDLELNLAGSLPKISALLQTRKQARQANRQPVQSLPRLIPVQHSLVLVLHSLDLSVQAQQNRVPVSQGLLSLEPVNIHQFLGMNTNIVKLQDQNSSLALSLAGDGADPNKPRCKKARELRKERKLSKLSAKGLQLEDCDMTLSADTRQNEGKTLEELLSEPDRAEKCAHKLEVRLVRSSPRSQEFVDSLSESHSVYHRYQMCIHKDPEDKPSLKQYTRFLVDSPLEEEHEEGGLPQGYGSFHQQYILDGKIICVGVIDILPSLVSSKYLYYDPDYEFLSLGTYSALREVAFVRDLHKYSKKMIYYYMGFYIHSCPKMKYKGQFQPSYLLCPETYTWHPVEKCQLMLDKWTYCRFADKDVEDENGIITLDNVLVLYRRSIMTFKQYKDIKKQQNTKEDVVKEYAGFVGKTCAERMLLYRDN